MNTVNRDYPYNREQPLEVEWQAPGQNNTGNTQWNGSTYRGTYQNHNQHSGGSGEPPQNKSHRKNPSNFGLKLSAVQLHAW